MKMSQTKITKVIPQLRYKLNPHKKLRNPEGDEGRLNVMRKTVTALFKYERLELNYNTADHARGYAERLISDAIRYGDRHKETMDMATYWICEKQLVHKLFKVLVPRYKNCNLSYTKIWLAPSQLPNNVLKKCVLELRGNVYPPIVPKEEPNPNHLHNVLLKAAKDEYNLEKALAETERKYSAIEEVNEEENDVEEESCSEDREGSEVVDGSDGVAESKIDQTVHDALQKQKSTEDDSKKDS